LAGRAAGEKHATASFVTEAGKIEALESTGGDGWNIPPAREASRSYATGFAQGPKHTHVSKLELEKIKGQLGEARVFRLQPQGDRPHKIHEAVGERRKCLVCSQAVLIDAPGWFSATAREDM
jgi:hypothetical protein